MPAVTNRFGGDRSLTTSLPREGLDIGAQPNFFADLSRFGKIKKKASGQAEAIRNGGGLSGPSAPARDYEKEFNDMNEAVYGVSTQPGGGPSFYSSWVPGMNLGTGQQPTFMGYRRRG